MLDRKIAEQAIKNTEYTLEIETFLFCFSRVFLFLYFFFYSGASMLFYFEHVSGSVCFLTGTDVVLGF